jgi:hypothetical protein
MLRRFDTQILSEIIFHLGALTLEKCNFYQKNLCLEYFDKNLLFRNLVLDVNKLISIDQLKLLPKTPTHLKIYYSSRRGKPIVNPKDVLEWIPLSIKVLDLSGFEISFDGGMIQYINQNSHPNLISASYLLAHAPFYSPMQINMRSYDDNGYIFGTPNTTKFMFGSNNLSEKVSLYTDFSGSINKDEITDLRIVKLQECYPVARIMELCHYSGVFGDCCFEFPKTLEFLTFYSYREDRYSNPPVQMLKINTSIKKLDIQDAILWFDPNITFSNLTTVKIENVNTDVVLPDSVTNLDIDTVYGIKVLPPNLVRLSFNFVCCQKDKSRPFYQRVDWVKKIPLNLSELSVKFCADYDPDDHPQGARIIGKPLDSKELLYIYSNLPTGLLKLDFHILYPCKNKMALTIRRAEHLPPNLQTLIFKGTNEPIGKSILEVLPKSITILSFSKMTHENIDVAKTILPNLVKIDVENHY